MVAWSTPPPSLAISLALKFDFPTTTVYCSSMAHWHAQNFERGKKIKGAGLRSSTLFVHLVCDGGHMPMPFAKAKKKKGPFGTWIPRPCHGDDDFSRPLAGYSPAIIANCGCPQMRTVRETCGGDGNSLSKPIVGLGNLDKRSPTSQLA